MKSLNLSLLLALFVLLSTCQEQQQALQPINEPTAVRPDDDHFLQKGWPDGQISYRAYTKGLQKARTQAAEKGDSPGFDQDWRTVGPANIGARINTIAVHPDNDNIMLVGFSRGGVWRTTDGGGDWTPVFDDQTFLSIGDITFDPSDPNTIYVGTGDPNISASFMIGDGIYRSTDGGDTWANIGMGSLNIITQIRVHPTNPNTIYAAAMGVPFERDEERGLYRTTDGGQNWEKILYVSNQSGIIDLVMDHSNPEVLYASSWDRIRNNMESTVSGPNAKIFKTTNGGDNWEQLTNGLPEGNQGRIGLTMAANNNQHLYASYTGTNSELFNIFESLDGGQSWAGVINPESINPISLAPLGGFGWYFGKIRVNPTDENDIYLLGVDLWRSRDGGENWELGTPPWFEYSVHADKHDLVWNAQGQALLATDGGLYRASNDMQNWEDAENIPCTQFYRVAVNPHEPNNYYGGAQDNGSTGGSNLAEEWPRIYGGDGFQMAFHPTNDQVFFAETQNGNIVMTDDGGSFWSGANDGIEGADRQNWDMQYILSPHNPETMYTGTFRVYQAQVFGTPQWFPISEDLTDGLILHPRYHSITCINESILEQGQVYVGTTDGNVWRTSPSGSGWTPINNGLPDRYVSEVKPSPDFVDGVYVSMSAYKDYDFSPLLFRSMDRGQNWESIAGDLPNLSINDIYIYPNTGDSLLFVATDGGVYASKTAGTEWERLGNNLPFVAVKDLEINFANNELVAGTFARSINVYPLDSIFSVADPVTTNNLAILEGNLWLSPNPSRGESQLNWKGLAVETTELTVVDQQGRALWNSTFVPNGTEGTTAIELPSQLAAGMYYVRVQQQQKIKTMMLSLVR